MPPARRRRKSPPAADLDRRSRWGVFGRVGHEIAQDLGNPAGIGPDAEGGDLHVDRVGGINRLREVAGFDEQSIERHDVREQIESLALQRGGRPQVSHQHPQRAGLHRDQCGS